MAKELRYNPSIDNYEEVEVGSKGEELAERMINPKIQQERKIQTLEDFKRKALEDRERAVAKAEGKLGGKQIQSKKEQKILTPLQLLKQQKKGKEEVRKFERLSKPTFLKRLGFLRRAKPIQDRLKVMRLSNMLEKKRLINQIEKMKLQRRMELLRQKGQLQQVITTPIIRMPLYPPGFTPEVIGDINSSYQDLNPAINDFWGNENYYDEDFYTEDFYGNEFNTTPEFQLSIKPRRDISPLLW